MTFWKRSWNVRHSRRRNRFRHQATKQRRNRIRKLSQEVDFFPEQDPRSPKVHCSRKKLLKEEKREGPESSKLYWGIMQHQLAKRLTHRQKCAKFPKQERMTKKRRKRSYCDGMDSNNWKWNKITKRLPHIPAGFQLGILNKNLSRHIAGFGREQNLRLANEGRSHHFWDDLDE